MRVEFGTLSFETFLGRPPEEGVKRMVALKRHKPSVIDFNGPARDARVVMTWRNQKNVVNRFGFELKGMIPGGDRA